MLGNDYLLSKMNGYCVRGWVCGCDAFFGGAYCLTKLEVDEILFWRSVGIEPTTSIQEIDLFPSDLCSVTKILLVLAWALYE